MSDEDAAIRATFEEWYANNAFDFAAAPIGSRDCGLQWKAWKEAHARGIVAGMRRAAEIAEPHHTGAGAAGFIRLVADKLEREQEQSK